MLQHVLFFVHRNIVMFLFCAGLALVVASALLLNTIFGVLVAGLSLMVVAWLVSPDPPDSRGGD